MRKIIRLAIKYKKITLVFLGFLILFGLYNYYISPKQEFPEIDPPVALITVQYPGASPEDVEALVTTKIEDEITELEGYDYSYSFSRNSLAVIFVRLGINADYDEVWTDLREKMDEVKTELPNQVKEININTDLIDTAGLIISLSSDDYSSEYLTEKSKALKNELRRVKGISRIDIVGERKQTIEVTVNYQKLNEFQLSLDEIVQLIESNNVTIPSGTLEYDDQVITFKTEGTYRSIEDIKNLVIAVSSENGSIAKLSDIADIHYVQAENDQLIRENGQKAVLIAGYFDKDQNVVLTGDEIDKIIANFEQHLNEDIQLNKVSYQPQVVQDSINAFNINLLQGMVFVIIVVLIGLGLKNAIIVSTAIPASILITFNFIKALDIPIHQISIASLIVSLGMLVDNAIVISDAIQVKLDAGEDKLTACIEGTYEVAIPVLSSTLTTIAAFLPLLLLTSIAGEYIQALPSIIMIALSVSFLIAILVTPTLSYIFFQPSSQDKSELFLKKYFKKLLKKSLKHKIVTFGIIILLLVMTGLIAMDIGLKFFPYADINLIYIDITNEKNNNLNDTQQKVIAVEDIIKKTDHVINYTSSIGDGLPKFYNTMPINAYSEDFGQIVVKLDRQAILDNESYTDLSDYVSQLQGTIDRSIVGADVTVNRIELAEPIGHPIRIRVLGENLDDLQAISAQLKQQLEKIPGTMNVGDDFVEKTYNMKFFIEDYKANPLGISNYNIQNEVSIAVSGRKASTFRTDGNEHDIIVNSNVTDKDDLENLFIKSSITNKKVQLKNLGTTQLVSEYPIIKKYDKEKSVLVYSDVKFGSSSLEIRNEIDEFIDQLTLDPGVRIIFDGEQEKIQENFGDISTAAIIAIALVFLILLIQFHSYKRTFVILVTIPLSAIGSFVGLYVTRQDLSFVAMLGIVSLFGIVVNNAIVLVDFIDKALDGKTKIHDACIEAFDQRFRPIILSTTTTIIGLTPLVYTKDVMFMPLAIALMFGLLISTLLTLIFLPTIYSLVISNKNEDKVVLLKKQLDSLKNS